MRLIEAGCGLSIACVAYAYAVYPATIALMARRKAKGPQTGPAPASASVVVAACGEPALQRRVDELYDLIQSAGVPTELIVVLDGPTEYELATPKHVRVIELPERRGKAAALSVGCAAARNEILIFADVRQTWEPRAMPLLLGAFVDPQVGAVSGELMIERESGVAGGVGLYWRYEKWIRQNESRFHSTVGVTGAISAVRRELFRPMPGGLLLDDVYWPLRVSMDGYRTLFIERARAHDRLSPNVRDEFRRKVRTLSGNFQLLQLLSDSIVPWRNPLWWQFVSHKLMRLLVPWALLGLLGMSALLVSPAGRVFLAAQCAGYGVAIFGLTRRGMRFRPAAAGGAFLMLNAAAWLAFWVWILRRTDGAWKATA